MPLRAMHHGVFRGRGVEGTEGEVACRLALRPFSFVIFPQYEGATARVEEAK